MPYGTNSPTETLRYRPKRPNRRTVQRVYAHWRALQGLRYCCDNPACQFRQQSPLWNGYRLPLLLRHRNGRSRDNRPENLWYLCPNCDAQLSSANGSREAAPVAAR